MGSATRAHPSFGMATTRTALGSVFSWRASWVHWNQWQYVWNNTHLCIWGWYMLLGSLSYYLLHKGIRWYWEWCTAHLITNGFFTGFQVLPTHSGWLAIYSSKQHHTVTVPATESGWDFVSLYIWFNTLTCILCISIAHCLHVFLLLISQTQTIQINILILCQCMLK